MSRGMGPTKAELLVILLISAILALESETVSSAVENLMVEQCKHKCKRMKKETHGRQEEEQDPFCEAFCKHFSEDGEKTNQRCMTVCPRTKSIPKMTAIERQQEVGDDSVGANGASQTKCNRKCSSYTEPDAHKRCMSQRFRSIISKTVDNEAVCETTCTVLREKPLSIECIRVCHERIPGAFDAST